MINLMELRDTMSRWQQVEQEVEELGNAKPVFERYNYQASNVTILSQYRTPTKSGLDPSLRPLPLETHTHDKISLLRMGL